MNTRTTMKRIIRKNDWVVLYKGSTLSLSDCFRNVRMIQNVRASEQRSSRVRTSQSSVESNWTKLSSGHNLIRSDGRSFVKVWRFLASRRSYYQSNHIYNRAYQEVVENQQVGTDHIGKGLGIIFNYAFGEYLKTSDETLGVWFQSLFDSPDARDLPKESIRWLI
jgi:hypothetical protein